MTLIPFRLGVRVLPLAALALGIAVLASDAAAHPHVWIDATANLVFKSKKIVAMNVTWVFDELYSQATNVLSARRGSSGLSE